MKISSNHDDDKSMINFNMQDSNLAATVQIDPCMTVIGEDSNLTGEMNVKGSLAIFGRVEGSVRCDGEVVIQEIGFVKGEILAMNIQVSGKLEGSLECGTLKITETGQVIGQTATDTFVIDAGGYFEGESKRRTADNVTQLTRSKSS